jgi:Phage portal protein, lambda family
MVNPLEYIRQRSEARAMATLLLRPPTDIVRAGWVGRRQVKSSIKILSKRHKLAIKNWYEGGFPIMAGDQSWLNQVIQDSRFDKNFVTRREMMRRMRNHAQDVPVHKRGLDLSRQYVIGTHMPVVTSTSSDSEWSALAEEVWQEMCESAGLNGESLYQMLCIGHDCKKNDGDVGFLKTFKAESRTIRAGTKYETIINVNRPCYQMVEAHRIETPFNQFDREGKSVIDGVEFRPIVLPVPGTNQTRQTLQKVGYWVKDTVDAISFKENYILIPVEAMDLIFTSNRVNDIRGISDYYAVENTLHYLRDILKLEMRAQEVQSDITIFITNGAGQILSDKMNNTLGAFGIKVSKDPVGNPIVTANDIQKAKTIYDQIWGGRKFIGRTNDTMEFMAPCRPSEATQNLWQYLIDSYAVGARLPRALLFPKTLAGKGQGTEIRAELDSANSGFISEFNLCWKPCIKRAWKYFIGWAKENDPRLVGAPPDWHSVDVSPPRSVLVDAGYDSAATINELQEGLTNTHYIAQNLGTTEDQLIAGSVRSLVKLKVACAKTVENPDVKKYGITISANEVRQSLSQVQVPSETEDDNAMEPTSV